MVCQATLPRGRSDRAPGNNPINTSTRRTKHDGRYHLRCLHVVFTPSFLRSREIGGPMSARTGQSSFDALWMPFTANRRFKARPRMLVSADGMYYQTPEGRPVLDGTAGLWCVNAGHRHRRVIEAVQR